MLFSANCSARCNPGALSPVMGKQHLFVAMKHRHIIASMLGAMLIASCSKNNAVPLTAAIAADEGFIQNSTQPVGVHSLPASQVLLINSLFDRNLLNHATLRYFQYQRDSLRNFSAPTRVLSEVVRTYEFVNGLQVFTAQTNFIFWNGDLHYRAGKSPGSTAISAGPRLTLPQLRGLFKDAMARFDPGNTVENQCLDAELGYYDRNIGQVGRPEKLEKAWKITKQGQAYPLAFFQDDNGELIYYDNGLRTFR